MLNNYPLAKDLQVLVEIVHTGSFSAAAAALERQTEELQRSVQQFRLSHNDAQISPAKTVSPVSPRGASAAKSGDEWVAF